MTPQQNEVLLKVYNDQPLTDHEKGILKDFFSLKKRPKEHLIQLGRSNKKT